MTQSGGLAAIYGFLYQMLHHIDWLTTINLTGKLDGQEFKEGLLILEPENGGDAQVCAKNQYLVEQYKTRASNTWPLSDVEKVLRDLRKSVPEDCFPEFAKYRFVTNGRSGKLDEFKSFISRLQNIKTPDELDNEIKREFSKKTCLTDFEFLEHLAKVTRENHKNCAQVDESERKSVFHLIRHFEMEFDETTEKLADKIEGSLRTSVKNQNQGDETKARHHLIGKLMESLVKNNKLNKDALDQMLKEVDLDPDCLRKVRELARRLEEKMHRDSKYIGYQREHDVRDVLCWKEDKDVLLIVGKSGAGKSWKLIRLIEEMVRKNEPVVFVHNKPTAKDILQSAADAIWQFALVKTDNKTLQGLSNFLQVEGFGLQPPLYTIAVDDVCNPDIAKALIYEDWTSLHARLVMTIPSSLVETLDEAYHEKIQECHVDDFSSDELYTLFKKFGAHWKDLPDDLKHLLRKPIRAGLYLKLEIQSFQDAPQSEYEIFQKFWDRIEKKCNPNDKGIVRDLAEHAFRQALDNKSGSYRICHKDWLSIGLDDGKLEALEGVGWLISSEGDVKFAHDRLLNWAVAQWLFKTFQDVDTLYGWIGKIDTLQWSNNPDLFNYVLMDILWLLSPKKEDTKQKQDANLKLSNLLIEKMESDHQRFGRYGKDLYTKLLPTLGQYAVSIFQKRLRKITNISQNDCRVNLIAEGFATLAKQKSVDVQSDIKSLLESRHWDHQYVALKMLTVSPKPNLINRLWELHQQWLNQQEHNNIEYRTTFWALRVAIIQQPNWLRESILKSDSTNISELVKFLSNLDGQKVDDIWNDVHEVLMERVLPDNPRCLLKCIARFSDYQKKDFVIKHLSHQDAAVRVDAMLALTAIDPREAINQISHINDDQKNCKIELWLPALLQTDSKLTLMKLRELAVSGSRDQNLIELFFEKKPAYLDKETLNFVLQNLEKQCREDIDKLIRREGLPWEIPLQFLSRICRPCILQRLNEEAGGLLEAAIVKIACSRLQLIKSISQDSILENVHLTLLLIGGTGISDLINCELESEHFHIRNRSLKWALIRGNNDRIERLAAIARRPIPHDSAGQLESREFPQATIALAVLGAYEILVEIFSSSEFLTVDSDLINYLARCRDHRKPISKSLTNHAAEAIRNPKTPDQKLCNALVVTWLSGDADFIPDVRNVLGRVKPESKTALYACIALWILRDKTPEFAQMAEQLTFTKEKENCRYGLRALIELGKNGLENLTCWLKEKMSDENQINIIYIISTIRALHSREESRDYAIRCAADLCLSSQKVLHGIAAESTNKDVREKIFEKAFSDDITTSLNAIRGLKKFNPDRAAEAVMEGLSKHPNQENERELCQLLVQLEPEKAAEKLAGAAINLNRDSLCDAVGQALRQTSQETVAEVIKKHLRGTEIERQIACRIARWLPFPAVTQSLESTAKGKSSSSVYKTALDALYRHREEAAIRDLFSEFKKEGCEARRWAFFVSILEIADPHLLYNEKDDLWIGHILKPDIPYAFWYYACEKIKNRIGQF